MEQQKEKARRPPGRARARRRPRRVWFEVREKAGATEFLGYDTETRRGRGRGASCKDGKEAEALEGGRDGALVAQPDAVLRRSRAARSATRALIKGAKGALFRVADTQKKLGDLFVHLGTVEKGAFKVGDAVELEVDHARARRSAPTTRRRTSCTRRCARCSARTSRRRARSSRRTGCASTSRTTKPMTAEEIARRRGPGQRHRSCRTRRSRRA